MQQSTYSSLKKLNDKDRVLLESLNDLDKEFIKSKFVTKNFENSDKEYFEMSSKGQSETAIEFAKTLLKRKVITSYNNENFIIVNNVIVDYIKSYQSIINDTFVDFTNGECQCLNELANNLPRTKFCMLPCSNQHKNNVLA